MSQMIAYCGLVCSSCPAFLATKNDDNVARAKTAALYSEKFGVHLKPEEINCEGCKSTGGKQLGYCQTCAIRQCCSARGLDNCATCDQPCENLSKFHEFAPHAKACLEALKKQAG
ncbi:MAG: DUF3795 domain-containing protein [Syntrophobacteraceae bacterium]|jgi:hypothetical protein